DVRGRHSGDLGVVVGRSHLGDIRTDQIEATESAQDLEQLAARDAAGLGGAGTGSVGRIHDVHIDRDVERAVADAVAELRDDLVDALAEYVAGGDDAEAEATVVLEVALAVERA